jgi:hypothetical protein
MFPSLVVLLLLLQTAAALKLSLAGSGGCDPTLDSCNDPWTTPAANASPNQFMVSMGGSGLKAGGGPGGLLADEGTSGAAMELTIPAFEVPAFEDFVETDFNPSEKLEFPTFQAQIAETPKLQSSSAMMLSSRSTTTPPPYNTVAIELNDIPMFSTKDMTIFKPFPAMDAISKLATGGPYLRALKQFLSNNR